jgi:hypothetical protein
MLGAARVRFSESVCRTPITPTLQEFRMSISAARQARPPQLPGLENSAAIESALRRNFHATDRMFEQIGVDKAHLPDIKADIHPIDPETRSEHFHNAAWIPGTNNYEIGHYPNGPSFAFSKDTMAHERSHAVVNSYAHLLPLGETGAVNESLADTFAMDVDKRNWTIGESVTPGGMRSLKNPSREQDSIQVQTQGASDPWGGLFGEGDANVETRHMPRSMDEYMKTQADNGGVHINMGIPNRAAYLIGSKLGRDEMAKLYLSAIRDHGHTTSVQGIDVNTMQADPSAGSANLLSIGGLAQSTIDAAKDLYKDSPDKVQTVRDAWTSVGVTDAQIAKGIEKQEHTAQLLQQKVDEMLDSSDSYYR